MKKILATLTVTLLVVINIFSQKSTIPPQLQGLIDAERAFARRSVEKGIQSSFLEWFADDGINFQPGPTNLRQSLSGRPVSKDPPPIVLNWAPVYGDISLAGDLGYSTGPYLLEDRGPQHRPAQHGIFFSIWKKQTDGAWKVAVDLGVELDKPYAPLNAEYRRAGDASKRNPLSHDDALSKMLMAEESFLAEAKGGAAAWDAWLSKDARIYRPNQMPVIGATNLRRWIAQQGGAYSGKNLKSDLAASGDMGYTVGSYEMPGRNVSGYYVRVWKLAGNAQWRIVFDVTNIAPKG